MKSLIFALVISAVLVIRTEAQGKNWILLIAGSNTYYNYRHQADVCHAYQIFHKAGIPDEQIVVMMYDDIANNSENPVKGNIINRPGGPNVYPGVPKDYTGKEVNAKMFLAVLQGDKKYVNKMTGQKKKVIDSGPHDHIFVYFADHGTHGMLCMPNSSPNLLAYYLNEALENMHARKRFAKLAFYVEACESGSVFENYLRRDINVYVTTAASPHEPSYSCYWDEQRKAFLGDVYSVKWMEDTEKANMHRETLEWQYIKVRFQTRRSHVMQYGDTLIARLTLDKFFSNSSHRFEPENFSFPSVKEAVPSEMVRVQTLKNRIAKAPLNCVERENLKIKLYSLYDEMRQTHDLFNNIARTVYSRFSDKEVYNLAMRTRGSIKNWGCYEIALNTLFGFCPNLDGNNDFALRKLYILVNLCNDQHQGKVIYAIVAATSFSPLCLK